MHNKQNDQPGLNHEPYNQVLDYYNRRQTEAQTNYENSLDNVRQQLNMMRSENEVLRQIATEYFNNINSINQVSKLPVR